MSNVLLQASIKCVVLLCLCLTALGNAAQASSWAVARSKGAIIFAPQAKLDGVTTEAFYYGDDSTNNTTIGLEGFGQTSAVYYKVLEWTGDNPDGSGIYTTPSAWSCHDRNVLRANGNSLKLALASGRYKVSVVSVMANYDCNIYAFTAGNLPSSVTRTTDPFMVIERANLAPVAGEVFIQQDPELHYPRSNSTDDLDGLFVRYDLQLKWPDVFGADGYKLVIFKNNVRYEHFYNMTNPIAKADYDSEVQSTGFFTLEDEFFPAPAERIEDGTFTEYTGPGEYHFAVSYCFEGNCSSSIPYTDRLTVTPLVPPMLYAYNSRNLSELAANQIRLDWKVDKRTTQFMVTERECTGIENPNHDDRACNVDEDFFPVSYQMLLPNEQTMSHPFSFPITGDEAPSYRDEGRTISYLQLLQRNRPGEFRYNLYVCTDDCTAADIQPGMLQTRALALDENSHSAFGQFETYTPGMAGNIHLRGFASDLDAQANNAKIRVRLSVNGHLVASQMADLTRTTGDSGYGFDFDLEAIAATANPSFDLNAPLILGLSALDYGWNNYVALETLRLDRVYKSRPVAVADSLNLERDQGPYVINVTSNDTDFDGSIALLVPEVTRSTRAGTVSVQADNSLVYTLNAGATPSSDDFIYRVRDNFGQWSDNTVQVTLNFADLVAYDDAAYVDWGAGTAQPVTTGGKQTVAMLIGSASVNGNTLTLDVTSNDYNGNEATIVADNQPAHGVVSIVNNQFSYVPDGSQSASDCFDYHLSSAVKGISEPASVCIYTSPTPVDDDAGALPDTPVYIDVVANDHRGEGVVENKVLKPTVVQPVNGAVRVIAGDSPESDLNVDSDYIVKYTPNAGFVGTDTFTYTLDVGSKDGQTEYSGQTSATVTVVVGTPPASVTPFNVIPQSDGKSFVLSWATSAGNTYQVAQLGSDVPVNLSDLSNRAWVDFAPTTSSQRTVSNLTNGHYYFRIKACTQGSLCSGWTTSTMYTVAPPNTDAVFGAPDSPYSDVTADVTSDTIGTIKGNAGISGGAASYSVPIQLPPGRAGMQPGVSLNYSSNGGNGLVGQGWSLSASGGISRCASTFAIDALHNAVQYGDADRLCLNGQRLKWYSGSPHGQSGAVYYPEMGPTTKVTLMDGNWTTDASSFKVELGNGNIQYYGNTANSVLTPDNISTPHSWLLAQSRDPHDNTIDYSYNGGAISGVRTLNTITYTGRDDTPGDRKVTFGYQTRSDVAVGYRAGGRTLHNQRLKTIITSVDDVPVHQYNLTYQDEVTQTANYRKSILTSLEQCFGEYNQNTQNCLPATQFEVKGLESNVFAAKARFTEMTFGSTDDAAYKSRLSVAGDYDGDGMSDLVINGHNNSSFATVRSTRFGGNHPLTRLYANGSGQDWNNAKIINGQMDFNLDGKMDFVGLSDINQRDGGIGFGWFDNSGTLQETALGDDIPFLCSVRILMKMITHSHRS